MVALLSASVGAFGHAGHGNFLWVRCDIDAERVRLLVTASGDPFVEVLGTPSDDAVIDPITSVFVLNDEEHEARIRSGLRSFVAEAASVEIDGIATPPVLGELLLQPTPPPTPSPWPPNLEIEVLYATKGAPRAVSLTWRHYLSATDFDTLPGAESDNAPKLPVYMQLEAFDELKTVQLTPAEPQFTWHASNLSPTERVTPVIAAYEPPRLELPLVSLGVLVLGIGGLVGGRLVRPDRVRWGAVALGAVVPLGLAWLTRDAATMRVVAPWTPRVQLPASDEAREIFATLHRNVYRAFDYRDESDVYDVLAQSVDGPLLDDIYHEIFQSLIMRDQGGAVAIVDHVEMLETTFDEAGVITAEPGGAPSAAFDIDARWRVRGVVTHWGHVHRRTNEYAARYTVAQRGDRWKITAVDVLGQERIITPDDDPAGV